MPQLLSGQRRRDRQERPGAATVELATLLPFLTFMFVVAVDLPASSTAP
jgi:hypothetical protein